MRFSARYLFYTYLFYLWEHTAVDAYSNAGYYANTIPTYWVKKAARMSISQLSKELLIDSFMKRASINYMLEYYETSEPFLVATIVFKIRQKYNRMVYLYHRAMGYFEKFDLLMLFQIYYEVQSNNLEIEKLVTMLEEYVDLYKRKKRITRSGRRSLRELIENTGMDIGIKYHRPQKSHSA